MTEKDSGLSGLAEKYSDGSIDGISEDEILRDITSLIDEVVSKEKEIAVARQRIKELERAKKGESRVGRTRTAMWAIRGFTAENRLYIKMAGEFDTASSKQFSNQILSVLDTLAPECDVVVDIRNLKENGDKKNAFHVRKVACTLAQLNVIRVIRISEKIPKGVRKMVDSIFEELGLDILDVSSLEDASTLLKQQKHHLRV